MPYGVVEPGAVSGNNPGQGKIPRGAMEGWVLCACIVAAATAYSFRLISFLHVKEAILSGGLILMTLGAIRRKTSVVQGMHWFLPLWLGWVAAVICGVFTAQVPAHVIEDAVRAATLLLIAAYAWEFCRDSDWRRRIRTAMVVSAAVVAALALAQYLNLLPALFPEFPHYDQRLYSVFGNQDLLGGYMAISIPLLFTAVIRGKSVRWDAAAALALLTAVLVLSASRSAWLAAAVGIAVGVPWGAAAFRRVAAWGIALMAVVLIVSVFTWPQTSQRLARTFSGDDVGGRARLWFWDGTIRMLRDHPWCGVGLGNYSYWSPRYLGEALAAPGGKQHYHNEILTEHAHSEPLEYLAETGIAGGTFFLWMFYRTARRRGAAWGGLAASLVFCLFNAGFHSAPHALVTLLLASMLFSHSERKERTNLTNADPYWLKPALAGFAVALVATLCWAVLIPSYQLRLAEDIHLSGKNPVPYYEKVLAHRWPNAEAREEYGMALLDAGRADEAYTQLQKAQKGLDTGRLYLLLAVAAEQLGDFHAVRTWAEQCLIRWPDNSAARQLRERALSELGNQ